MNRKTFLPMWDSSKPKMTTSATLGLGKNCPHRGISGIFRFLGYFGKFLGFISILVILMFLGYFGNFLGFRIFGYFLGFVGILIIF